MTFEITPQTCVYKINAMRSAEVNERTNRCRMMCVYDLCEHYFPVYKIEQFERPSDRDSRLR